MPAEHGADHDHVEGHLDRARAAAHAGAEIPHEARLRDLKRAMVAPLRPVTSVQHDCNDALIEAASALRHDQLAHEQAIVGLRATNALTDAALDELHAELRALRQEVAALRAERATPSPSDGPR